MQLIISNQQIKEMIKEYEYLEKFHDFDNEIPYLKSVYDILIKLDNGDKYEQKT